MPAMPRLLHVVFTLCVATVMIAGPWWYTHLHDRHFRSLHVVEDGVLYRSGQLDLEGLKTIVRDYRIKTIISLRDGDSTLDQDEVDWAPYAGITHIRIPPRPWQAEDGSVPAEQGLARFREVMDDPRNYPVLIHCFAGIHRTGAYCAVYRMDRQRWSNADAIAEMRTLGYTTLDGDRDILGFLERYRPVR
jgi:tyrosine-protein phosphatase SIW14